MQGRPSLALNASHAHRLLDRKQASIPRPHLQSRTRPVRHIQLPSNSSAHVASCGDSSATALPPNLAGWALTSRLGSAAGRSAARLAPRGSCSPPGPARWAAPRCRAGTRCPTARRTAGSREHRTRSRCRFAGWQGSPRAGRRGTAAGWEWKVWCVGCGRDRLRAEAGQGEGEGHMIGNTRCTAAGCLLRSFSVSCGFHEAAHCSTSRMHNCRRCSRRRSKPARLGGRINGTHHHQHLLGRLGDQRIQLHNVLAAEIHNVHAVALVGVGAVRIVKQVRLRRQGEAQAAPTGQLTTKAWPRPASQPPSRQPAPCGPLMPPAMLSNLHTMNTNSQLHVPASAR